MRFNVARLLKGTVGVKKNYTLDEFFASRDGSPVNHTKGSLLLMKTDTGVWVNGVLDVSSRASCSRCLEEATVELQLHLDDVYYPTVDVNTGSIIRLPEDAEGSCLIDANNVLDISEAVQQYTTVGQPMKPLCSLDCAGLCSLCGVNQNLQNCDCEISEIDSRWLPLMELASTTEKVSRS